MSWLNYTDSEVACFHPVCETALKEALVRLGQDSTYKVEHHASVGTLIPDFEIINRATGKCLCVFEVKRTKSSVNSARCQSQAQSYVTNKTSAQKEKDYYVLTNLECTYFFKFDPHRPAIYEQMLEPGLIICGDLTSMPEMDFRNQLADIFKDIINNAINDTVTYKSSFANFIADFESNKKSINVLNSTLACEFYEYIRGSLKGVGRRDLTRSVTSFHSVISAICHEGAKVNFGSIFSKPISDYSTTFYCDVTLLTELFELGQKYIDADTLSEILYQAISAGKSAEGEVSTDIELAQFLFVFAKGICGDLLGNEKVCDPAAGSGNLISAACASFPSLNPRQIKANDINGYLLQLLSLRIGLKYADVISPHNSPIISNENITNLDYSYFDNVKLIVLNPPFVAATKCRARKNDIINRLMATKGTCSTDVGQCPLEFPFIELITEYVANGTTLACIIPKTHLTARGSAANAFRKFLCNEFGLRIIVSYPGEGLFEKVTRDTVFVIGNKGTHNSDVLSFTSDHSIFDIDTSYVNSFSPSSIGYNSIKSIGGGLQAIKVRRADLQRISELGWRGYDYCSYDANKFITGYFLPSTKFQKVKDSGLEPYRGKCGNKGASDLLFPTSIPAFYSAVSSIVIPHLKPGMRNTDFNNFEVNNGDQQFLDISAMSSVEIDTVIKAYIPFVRTGDSQARKVKSVSNLKKILEKESINVIPQNSVLIPRNLRVTGRVFRCTHDTFCTTNMYAIEMNTPEDSYILTSWMSTIFYQLDCELEGKNEEGTRKMEGVDIDETYVPIISALSPTERMEILTTPIGAFLRLQSPTVRPVDMIWAKIILGSSAGASILASEAQRILNVIAKSRNS